jgi:peptidoglycan/xylan/chitin deacetylase (PgdA/CDA1 family)
VEYFLANWIGPCAIFCLHRVLPDDQVLFDQGPLQNLALSESNFYKLIKFLSDHYQIVSIDELVSHLESGSKEQVVCLTFDDGYHDNLSHALPILEHFNAPATIFITTSFIDNDSGIWWYKLWHHIERKDNLELEYDNTLRKWDCLSKTQKNRCYSDLHTLMMGFSLKQQNAMLGSIKGMGEVEEHNVPCLDWDDIQLLDKHPLITIGAHTTHHSILSAENEENARLEIIKSKQLLESYLEHPVEHFAYPFGTLKQAGLREYKLAEECGFKTASTTCCFRANVKHFYNLPRYGVTDSISPVRIKTRMGGLSNFLGKQLE